LNDFKYDARILVFGERDWYLYFKSINTQTKG